MDAFVGFRPVCLACAAAVFCCFAAARRAPAAEPSRLEFRQLTDRGIAKEGTAIPREAVQVFTYEGEPVGVRTSERWIAVDYRYSGVLFERATGKLARRFTIADGWPEARPEPFGGEAARWPQPGLVGPGVNCVRRPHDKPPEPVTVAAATFAGRQWRAIQPSGFLNALTHRWDWKELRGKWGAWTPILRKLNEEAWLEAVPEGGGEARRFAMADGLASNIVTHLVVAQGALWAACVDVYDPARKEWGPGGLCRFDPATSRWQRIERIDGRPVRWVTLLQAVGDELWVGFREGSGVAGDQVVYGMGLYPGHYRPHTTAIVLARLADGAWSTFARPPAADPPSRWSPETEQKEPPTETPRKLARSGDRVLLFSQTRSRRRSGNWEVPLDGQLSLLDLTTKQWRLFDLYKDLDADVLYDLVAEGGEVLVTSNRGVHRWDAAAGAWRFLDPECALLNPAVQAVTPVGDELWVGYTNQSFGVIGQQGISRFGEKTGRWTHMCPEELGTACPVWSIVAEPNGDVTVTFRPRLWISAAVQFPYYPRENWRAPRGTGRFADGKWSFAPDREARPTFDPTNAANRALLDYREHEQWAQNWTEVPTTKPGRWALGPLDSRIHRAIASPHAVWIASRAELIRLGRQRLPEWLERKGE